MDFYPEDLLVGVFPLVFAVNSILGEETFTKEDSKSSSSHRSLFEKFLDAIAASLIHDGAEEGDRKRTVSLFRSEDESSDDDDTSDGHYRRKGGGALSTGIYSGFGRRNFDPSRLNNVASKTAYAKALQHGEGFFERARIESVSTKHGFPPSKDPEGHSNLAQSLPAALSTKDNAKLKSLFEKHPLDGILPSGWLEKHVHALPSVILVVCTVSSSQTQQDRADKHLYNTVEHLYYSLVPKRQCTIHVIGLLQDNVTIAQGDGWCRAVNNEMLGNETGSRSHKRVGIPPLEVSILRTVADLESNDTGLPTSDALRALHRRIRSSSLQYYLSQARRTKEKLALLKQLSQRGSGPPEPLLPLLIRYCFKIAIFYEFQWKHEKSLKFMSDAYLYVTTFYQYLQLRRRNIACIPKTSEKLSSQDAINLTADNTDIIGSGSKDDQGSDSLCEWWYTPLLSPTDDMAHQCRAVAEWLHLKLLLAGFVSGTTEGLLASSQQWRQHVRIFATRRRPFPVNETAVWYDWVYILQQRVVLGQLLERHPPKVSELANGELQLQFSIWKCRESAVEALLGLANALDYTTPTEDMPLLDPMRARYVGQLDPETMQARLRELMSVDHRAKALDLVLQAISSFEQELEEEKRGFFAEDVFSEGSSSRTGARLYYLAGGILLAKGRHQEAVGQLQKASKLSRGWRELELAIRRMLIECYERHLPSASEAKESSQTLGSMILDSYFNAEMSSTDLRCALNHFASINGGNVLRWYHDTVEEDNPSLPFCFQITFPNTIFATAGDTVDASILIKSNLDYAVHINSVTLVSLAGDLPIAKLDLLGATNASEGDQGKGIIVQRNSEITISTSVKLPKDVSAIATDDSGNGGETQGKAGKGSFAKSARPRTSGITSAGGARLVSEDQLVQGNSVSQGWNMRFLGGKPLRCDGLKMTFYPVQVEKAIGGEAVTFIELWIEKKESRTAANIKRTPFEEENYIASAWSRPWGLPLSRGPRSIRVLDPTPQLVIRNLTDPVTKGTALEGTVNRTVLQLQAGPSEMCTNIEIKVSCFSVLVTPNGATKRLVSVIKSEEEVDGSINMNNPAFRTPTLLRRCPHDAEPSIAERGYKTPPGWRSLEATERYKLPSLRGGEATLFNVDMYRPAPFVKNSSAIQANDVLDGSTIDYSICKTDFYVTVTYQQERPAAHRKKGGRRTGRQKPQMSRSVSAATEEANPVECAVTVDNVSNSVSTDLVSLEYSSSVIWTQPLIAKFALGTKKQNQSGSRHPSNSLLVEMSQRKDNDSEFSLIDGEHFVTKCSLTINDSIESLRAELVEIRFEDNQADEEPLRLKLLNGLLRENSNVLYKPTTGDPLRKLGADSTFLISYAMVAQLKEGFEKGGVSAKLGSLLVDWIPSALILDNAFENKFVGTSGSLVHGPLAMGAPLTIRFPGPPCYIEGPPFETRLQDIDPAPQVSIPFRVAYEICNLTGQHQTLTISMDQRGEDGEDDALSLSGLIVSGLIHSELYLAPMEKSTFAYTALPVRAGMTRLPSLWVSSFRHNAWVVREDAGSQRPLCVLP